MQRLDAKSGFIYVLHALQLLLNGYERAYTISVAINIIKMPSIRWYAHYRSWIDIATL